ncbi:aKG-HExxH-type peptide beta-hydroxylase [Mucilaginibacter kameinonensis]|uniref:aKG-HExxH-type peptide beta-hydroxylase n=1 Tax=Mucilaginibacter kameinonensis TaxID=452286 RepID=UPI000EF767E8|nr:HEXXH motif-containing putative peptide modification protein [Mucilaginibacter kameinonensis]
MSAVETIQAVVRIFLDKPSPLWETGSTHQLVEAKYTALAKSSSIDRKNYSTAAVLDIEDASLDKQFLATYDQYTIYLEKTDPKLADFCEAHGLVPLTGRELIRTRAASKLKAALNILGLIPECAACIAELVNCIQVVTAEGPEFDTSYSHPNLPFTIFVSVCEDDSLNGDLRVAESILHEAMHLKLTLIQEYIELVKPDSMDTFFSPWRNVQRPLMGVLHGLFVFRAIRDLFQNIRDHTELNNRDYNFATYRMADIAGDFQALNNFCQCHGLTEIGRKLADQLQSLDFD